MVKSKPICEYEKKYDNRIKKVEEKFKCPDEAIGSGFCILHDPTYLDKATAEEVTKVFMKKVHKAIATKKPLLAIGYNLPSINISATFEAPVYFNYTTFNGTVLFEKTKFNYDANFVNTLFIDNTSFTGSQFSQIANFIECKFKNEVTFLATDFKNEARFNLAEFQKGLFSLAHFQKVNFFEAKFYDESEFKLTKFHDTALFQKSQFYTTDFTEAKFEKEARFIENQFYAQANFRKIKFTNSGDILFDGNLSKLSFLETDISKINFGDNIGWERVYRKPMDWWDKFIIFCEKLKEHNNKFKVQDERIIENKLEQNVRLETVMNIYRNLQENFDKKLNYDFAGEFFVREMELKRKFKKNTRNMSKPNEPLTTHKNILAQIFSVLSFYYVIAKYGESYYRPLKFVIPGLIFSTFYFWSSGFNVINLVFQSGFGSEAMNNAIIRSISAFFPFYVFSSHNALSDLLLRIALLPLLGALFISLRRKLERKYRH